MEDAWESVIGIFNGLVMFMENRINAVLEPKGNILSGFAAAGLIPFKPERVL